MKSKLFRRDFTIMIVGQIISLFGNSILRFALSLYVLDLTGSAAAFGGILALSMLPTVLLSPLGGTLADRVPRQKIMWGLDFATAGVILLFLLALQATTALWLVGLVMMLLSVIQSFYQPSVVSSVPLLVDGEHLMAANGVVMQVQALASLLGPILGGVLYGLLVPSYGMLPILAISALCFFLSAVMELFLKIPFTPQEGSGAKQVWLDLKSAFAFLRYHNPMVGKLLWVVAGLNLFLATLFIVGLPFLVKLYLGLSAEMYGFAEAALGCGMIIGGILSGVVAKKIGLGRSHWLLIGCALMMLPVVAALLLQLPALVCYGILVGAVLIGMVMSALFNIACQTYLQQMTPSHLLGKVSAFVTVICTCAVPIGQALYGVLFEWFSSNPWPVFLFGALISASLGLLAGRPLRALSERSRAESTAPAEA